MEMLEGIRDLTNKGANGLTGFYWCGLQKEVRRFKLNQLSLTAELKNEL